MRNETDKQQRKIIFCNSLVQAGAYLVVLICAITFFFLIYNYNVWTGKLRYILSGLKSIIIGIVIAYLLNPIVRNLEKKLLKLFKKTHEEKKTKAAVRLVSSLLIVLVFVFVVGVLLYSILPEVIISISAVIRNSPKYIDEVTDLIQSNAQMRKILDNVLTNATDTITAWLNENVLSNIEAYVSAIASGVFSMVGVLVDILIGIIISVYVLCSMDTFVGQGKKLIYALLSPKQAKVVLDTMRKSNEIFGGFISGKLIDSLIIGVLCFIGLSLLHMPYVTLVAVIVGITNVIPFFGPYIGMVPSTILIMLVDFKKGIIALIFIIILQQLDGNVIGPKILGKSTGLSAFWVVFAVMFFGKAWGILGMFIGVPVFGVIYYIIGTFVNYQLEKRKLPVRLELYRRLDYIDESGEPILKSELTEKERKKREQKELRRQWMEENKENFERWIEEHKKDNTAE